MQILKYGCALLFQEILEVSDKMHVFLKDIVPAAQNNINTRFIILDKARSLTAAGASGIKSCIALAGDETGRFTYSCGETSATPSRQGTL